jgi:phospholipase/carboxylesterase
VNDAFVIQQPERADELFLLFHGVGATPQDLVPLGMRLAKEFPQAAIASVRGPDPSDLGAGRQWFSVLGVTEENRPARVAATLERFLATVRAWQQRTGVAPARTTLAGFSQGAIMALAASATTPAVAGRIVSLSGRYAELPQEAPAGVRVHFLHGDADPVIPAMHAERAVRQLRALGASPTMDLVPGLGHGMDGRLLDLLVRQLQT